MQYFNFERLIKKYSSEFTAITFTEAKLNDLGDYEKGEKIEIALQGAIISFSENKIHRSEGNITNNDKRLFTTEPIDKALHGAKVIYEENVYSIEVSTSNAKFTGVYSYLLKWTSAFKEGGK